MQSLSQPKAHCGGAVVLVKVHGLEIQQKPTQKQNPSISLQIYLSSSSTVILIKMFCYNLLDQN